MDRRTLLRGVGAGILWGMLPGTGTRLAWGSPDARNGRALVVIFLRGGCDGLNLAVPFGDDDYYSARPTLGIAPPSAGDPASALDLNGFFGLHPAMQALHRRYQDGLLAIVPTVHLPDGSLSHFKDQADLERAGGSDGWLGRYLASTPAQTSGFALATAPPLALSGPRPVPAYQDPFNLSLAGREAQDNLLQRVLQTAYPASGSSSDPGGAWGRVASVLLAERSGGRVPVPSGIAYPDHTFGAGLSAAAQLLLSDDHIAIVTLDLGGWDTHRDQGGSEGQQANLLQILAKGLDTFLAHLGPRHHDVAVLVQTEFGRTVAENGSGGTDHGRATTWLLLGGGVRGGLYLGAGWPGLAPSQLERGRYLAGAVDYRDVYAELLSAQLGATIVTTTLPGFAPTPLGLLA